MQHLSTPYKWIFFFVILLVALSMAVPALADYLGPNRTVTTTTSVCNAVLYECKEVNGHWKYKRMQDWSCPNFGDACAGYPSNSRPCSDESNVPGWEYCKKEESTQTIVTAYPPATISGSLQNCTLHGEWCNGTAAPVLALSAWEPVSGYSVLLIEGTLNEGLPNGTTFACPNGATSCSLPLNEGENCLAYWAHSTWGDTSYKGEICAKVDTISPSVGLDIQGTPGAQNWWGSAILVTPTSADAMPGSGVASMLLSLDGGATWQPSVTLNEGVYQVDVTVFDNAGNVSTSTTTLSIDTTTPAINMSVSGIQGSNSWWKSVIQVAGEPKDATSGVATFAVAVDGAAYQAYTAPVSFSDGQHTIQFKACDTAGNCTETPQQMFLVDTIPPTVNLPASWQLGTNIPYDMWDEGSCLAALRIVIEDEDEKFKKVAWDQNVSGCTYSQDINWDGKFKDGTVAPPGTYLVWLKASDLAGNEKPYLGKVIVPEPKGWFLPQPTAIPPTAELFAPSPVPPAELFETEAAPPVTEVPALGFGGETTQPGEPAKHSVILATGSAGAAKSSSSSSSVLWGPMAAAAIGAASAYAYAATRKRKEAEEEQAARVRAEIAHDKAERAQKQQKQKENYAKQKALEQAIQAYQQKKKQEAAYNARMEEKMAKRDAQDESNWVAAQVDIKKKAEAGAKTAEMLTSLPGYFESEKQTKKNETIITVAPPMCVAASEKKKPWWEKAIETTVDFIGGAGYQWGRNNMDALAIVNPLPGKEKYFRDMANVDAQMPDSMAFKWGRLVGGIAGIVQGIWEMASGIATATGGTVISCGTVILCIGGGGVSLAAGAALVLHGAAVTGTSIYQAGKSISDLVNQSKSNSEKHTIYESDTKEGKYIGRTKRTLNERQSEHQADGHDRVLKPIDEASSLEEARLKEQLAIDEAGGLEKLTNKRNELNPSKFQELLKKFGLFKDE